MKKRDIHWLIIIGFLTVIFGFTSSVRAELFGFEDFASLAKWWMQDCSGRQDCELADISNNGRVDFVDLKSFCENWLEEKPAAVGSEMMLVPSGTFTMGNSFTAEGDADELPTHTVTLDNFYICKYEITNQQYCNFLNSALSQGLITVNSDVVYKSGSGKNFPYCDTADSSPYSQIIFSNNTFTVAAKSGRTMANDPMVMISWYGAAAYCNWRSQQDGRQTCYNDFATWACDFSKKGYRLPTEAEWERAARGGAAGKRFASGNTISQTQANFYSSSSYSYDISPVKNIYHPIWYDGVYPYTAPVGFFDGTLKYKSIYNWSSPLIAYQTANGANGYGLYDMTGNVYEWCNDWYDKVYYNVSPLAAPKGPSSGIYRVVRGGYRFCDAFSCRVAARDKSYPYYRYYYGVGFRPVLDY